MTRFPRPLGASVLLMTLAAAPLWAGNKELKTVESAAEVVHAFAGIPLRGIPPALLHDARGVAIIPGVFKVGFLIDGRFGHGVVLARQPDGVWSNPVFVTLTGSGFGLQAGVQSTDLILIFKTAHSVDRIMKGKGKLVLGTDAAVAAGWLGRDAEKATDGRLKAEIVSYSRSRGLFAGLSLEGAHLAVDHQANKAFYHVKGGQPGEVMALHGIAAVEGLRRELTRLAPPAVVVVPFVPTARRR